MSEVWIRIFAIIGVATFIVFLILSCAQFVDWFTNYNEKSVFARRQKRYEQYLNEYKIVDGTEASDFIWWLIFRGTSDKRMRYFLKAITKDK